MVVTMTLQPFEETLHTYCNAVTLLGRSVRLKPKPHLFHKRGALCAARLGDEVNPNRESSGSQFYIVGEAFTIPPNSSRWRNR